MLGASMFSYESASRRTGLRSLAFVSALIWLSSTVALGHHSVIGVYDDQRRFTAAVEVKTFDLIDPHPLIFVEISGFPNGDEPTGIAVGQTWTLELDNARELRLLGFDRETFVPGDRLVVAVDPSRHTRYRENTLYVRGAAHPRAGFIYIHNLRELIAVESSDDNLDKFLHLVR